MAWTPGHPLKKRPFVVDCVLGEGGFGITYKVHHQFLDQDFVIKTPNARLINDPDYPKYLNRFIQEGQRVAKICHDPHPHIVRVTDLFEEAGTHCLVMDYVPGESLWKYVQNQGALSEAQAVRYIRQIGDALRVVHQAGLVHRDVTPLNIMVRSPEKAVLIDFGIAKGLIPTTSTTTDKAGNQGFAPYEQIGLGSREVTVDVYTLAASLYYAVTGQRPVGSLGRKLFNAELVPPQQIISGLSDATNQAILSGMALEAKNRPQSIEAWLALLTFEPPIILSVTSPSVEISATVQPDFSRHGEKSTSNLIPQPPGENSKPLSLQERGLERGFPDPVKSKTVQPAKTAKTLPVSAFDFEVVTVEVKSGLLGKKLTLNRRTHQAYHYIETLGDVPLEMVAIPGGTFQMGSPETEEGHKDNESPQHWVTIKPFFLGKYPITQAQWQAVAHFPKVERELDPDPSEFKGENRPVERVSWYDCVEFCARLSQYTGWNYRLPSEAEWEYACRAGTTTPFHFGETITTDLANYKGNYIYGAGVKGKYRKETTPVGSFQVANAFGLYDMHGNVWEWCLDQWHDSYEGAPSDGQAWIIDDDNDNHCRLLRGGSWFYNPRGCRCAARGRKTPDFRHGILGFRVVCGAAWTL
ncbi:MAG: bifunctional serine/threonine-protein kinase/formylglycine-generating enzyme family protein [Coleofasciculus sp. C1-SOL-03]|uniref:SUMF1/EgtB/PvdO family nonheme iron enzyme n=1 Tax=Coleofasciculus sp. C1-SOL-03 TaxID=3069522 RepID=UPI0032FAC51F